MIVSRGEIMSMAELPPEDRESLYNSMKGVRWGLILFALSLLIMVIGNLLANAIQKTADQRVSDTTTQPSAP
jgi:hypothetical protein